MKSMFPRVASRPFFPWSSPSPVWLLALPYCLIVFSSPIPIQYTWVEAIIGLGLMVYSAAKVRRIILNKLWRDKRNMIALVGMLYLLAVPLLIAFASNYPTNDIARDFVPVLFLMVPVLSEVSGESDPADVNLLTGGLVLVGVISAVQFSFCVVSRMGSFGEWISTMSRGLQGLPSLMPDFWDVDMELRDAMVRMYDPSVLFSAVILLCFGISDLLSRAKPRLFSIFGVLGGGFVTYCFMVIGLRAHSVLIIVSVFSYLIYRSIGNDAFRRRMLVILPIVLVISYPFVSDAVQLMLIKQKTVGSNGKLAEWGAVLSRLSTDNVVFSGIGWGGLLLNPITPYYSRFTHSLLSFYLLKTGLIGLGTLIALGVMMLSGRALKGIAKNSSNFLLLIASVPPILVGTFLQPSYKMIGFSLVLVVFFKSLPRAQDGNTESSPRN